MERETQALVLTAEARLGGVLPLHSGLHVLEGSSPNQVSDGLARVAPKYDALTAIPIINMIISDDPGADAFVGQLAADLGASRADAGDLPVAARAAEDNSFEVLADGVRLNVPAFAKTVLGSYFEQPIGVDERLRYFLELTQTVVLFIAVENRSDGYALSVVNSGSQPIFATRAGEVASPSFDAIVRNATWSAVEMPYARLAGRDAERHAHYELYESRPDRTFLPNVSYTGRCILCGSTAGSKEHCVPDWLATKELVEPLTSPLLCDSCNNSFGLGLETRISAAWTDAGLNRLIVDPDFALWATKTAFTCSVAAGLRVPFAWSSEIGQERMPAGFEVYANRCRVPEEGYSFIVTTFDNSGSDDGEFLFSFQSSDVYFVVAKAEQDLAACFGMPCRYPAAAASTPVGPAPATIQDAHEAAVTAITGATVEFSEGTTKRLKERRAKRS